MLSMLRATSAPRPSQNSTNHWLFPSSTMGVRLEHSWWRQEKGFRHSKTNDWESSSASITGKTKPITMYRARLKVLWANRNLSTPLLIISRWHGLAHITWHDFCKTIMQGAVKDGCTQGWHCKSWLENIKEWMDMTMLEFLKATANRSV